MSRPRLRRPVLVLPGTALEVRAVPGKGRAVFARRAVPAGRRLCRCPSIALSAEDCAVLNRTSLAKHFFTGDREEFEAWFALGPLSLVNHGLPANADWRFVEGGALGCLIDLVALRPIAAGEEVLIDYNTPLWFEPVG